MLEWYRQMDLALRLVALVIASITLSVLLLSAAGIALMSFTVAQRKKEIGIRAALGADAKRLLISIFSRAAGQLGAGVAAGVVFAIALDDDGRGSLARRVRAGAPRSTRAAYRSVARPVERTVDAAAAQPRRQLRSLSLTTTNTFV